MFKQFFWGGGRESYSLWYMNVIPFHGPNTVRMCVCTKYLRDRSMCARKTIICISNWFLPTRTSRGAGQALGGRCGSCRRRREVKQTSPGLAYVRV